MKEIKNNIGILIGALLGGVTIGFLIGHHSKGAVTAAKPEKEADKKTGFDGEEEKSNSLGSWLINDEGSVDDYSNDNPKDSTQKGKHKAVAFIVQYLNNIDPNNRGVDPTEQAKFLNGMKALGYGTLAKIINKFRNGVFSLNNSELALILEIKEFENDMKKFGYNESSKGKPDIVKYSSIANPVYRVINSLRFSGAFGGGGEMNDINGVAVPFNKANILELFDKKMIKLGW